jgi:hypothetical protein
MKTTQTNLTLEELKNIKDIDVINSYKKVILDSMDILVNVLFNNKNNTLKLNRQLKTKQLELTKQLNIIDNILISL